MHYSDGTSKNLHIPAQEIVGDNTVTLHADVILENEKIFINTESFEPKLNFVYQIYFKKEADGSMVLSDGIEKNVFLINGLIELDKSQEFSKESIPVGIQFTYFGKNAIPYGEWNYIYI